MTLVGAAAGWLAEGVGEANLRRQHVTAKALVRQIGEADSISAAYLINGCLVSCRLLPSAGQVGDGVEPAMTMREMLA